MIVKTKKFLSRKDSVLFALLTLKRTKVKFEHESFLENCIKFLEKSLQNIEYQDRNFRKQCQDIKEDYYTISALKKVSKIPFNIYELYGFCYFLGRFSIQKDKQYKILISAWSDTTNIKPKTRIEEDSIDNICVLLDELQELGENILIFTKNYVRFNFSGSFLKGITVKNLVINTYKSKYFFLVVEWLKRLYHTDVMNLG